MNKVLNTLFFCFIVAFSHAQKTSSLLDSLQTLVSKGKEDTVKVLNICKLSLEHIRLGNFDKAEKANQQLCELSTRLNYYRGKEACTYLNGTLLFKQQKYTEALPLLKKSLVYYEKIKRYSYMIELYANIAKINYTQGNYSAALDHFLKALKYSEVIKDQVKIAGYAGNIGAIYNMTGDQEKSLEFYEKSLEINSKIKNDQGIAINQVCIANVQLTLKDYRAGLKVAKEALQINERINNPNYLANNYSTLGILHMYLEEYENAEEYMRKSGEIYREMNNYDGISENDYEMSRILTKLKRYEEAEKSALESLKICEERKYGTRMKLLRNQLSIIYYNTGRYQEAADMYKSYIQLKDSLSDINNQKLLLKRQLEFDFEKKEAISKSEFDRLQALKQVELEQRKQALMELENTSAMDQLKLRSSNLLLKKEQAETEMQEKQLSLLVKKKQLQEAFSREKVRELKQQKIIRNGLIVGALLLLLLAFFILRSWRVTKKQNGIIESQKLEVEKQKHLAEQHNLEITDSITYALRIQQAILPSSNYIAAHLPHSYVLYVPKAIVAGDFYWMEHVDGLTMIAVADSTGHGVPGAMVSVVCSNALNRAVYEFNLRTPGEILDKTRELVLETFAKSNEEIKDGMDISLCVYDAKENILSWSGANNPLWYLKDGQFEEIKGDKQPVGKTDNPKPFTSHHIVIDKETQVFLFTDGFADQFGGEKGKKFKYKPFAELLASNTKKKLHQQKEQLHTAFVNWKGDLEQVDDVCIMSFVLEP